MSSDFADAGSAKSHPTGVVIVGSITADVTAFSGRSPARGETVLGDDLTLVLGGKGANQAVAAAKAGARTYLVGCVGNDVFQPLVRGSLQSYGVDLGYVRTVTGATGVAHIRVDASGENDIVIVPLANSKLDERQVDRAIGELAGHAAVLLTQLEIPVRIAEHAIRAGRAAGMTVILDPAPASRLSDDIWPFIDVVTPNETEAGRLSGVSVVDRESAAAAGKWFCDRGTGTAIVTLAANGAVQVTSAQAVCFEAYPVDPVDTTAAGDAFAGYLGAALAAGAGLDEAIPRAMAAGALTVTKRGASPSLPGRADVERLLGSAGTTPEA